MDSRAIGPPLAPTPLNRFTEKGPHGNETQSHWYHPGAARARRTGTSQSTAARQGRHRKRAQSKACVAWSQAAVILVVTSTNQGGSMAATDTGRERYRTNTQDLGWSEEQAAGSQGNQNVGDVERMASAVLGGGLLVSGLMRRSWAGAGLSVIGVSLLHRGMS